MTDAPQSFGNNGRGPLVWPRRCIPYLFADIDAAQAVGQLADEAGAQTGGPWFYPAI